MHEHRGVNSVSLLIGLIEVTSKLILLQGRALQERAFRICRKVPSRVLQAGAGLPREELVIECHHSYFIRFGFINPVQAVGHEKRIIGEG